MARPGPPRNVGAESDKSRISHRVTLLIKQLAAEEQGKKASGGRLGCIQGGWPLWVWGKPFRVWLVYIVKSSQDIEEEGGTAILLMMT